MKTLIATMLLALTMSASAADLTTTAAAMEQDEFKNRAIRGAVIDDRLQTDDSVVNTIVEIGLDEEYPAEAGDVSGVREDYPAKECDGCHSEL